MAEALFTVLLDNVGSVEVFRPLREGGYAKELNKIIIICHYIRAVLADAEMRQFTNRQIRIWLQKLEDAAHKLDDIIDEFATHGLRREYHHYSCHSSFGLKNAMLCTRMVHKMKKMRKTLESIAGEREKFALSESTIPTEYSFRIPSTSLIDPPQVYGREKDKEVIVQALIGTCNDMGHVSVYPIVGLGGVGKTTLAQLIYNDHRISDHFDLKLWVCVSDDFSLKRIIKTIIELASRRWVTGDLDLDLLHKQLQQTLQGKRYLLVLDDVWSEDYGEWDSLKSFLACGSRGASILVTTRLSQVASIMGTFPPYKLLCLSDEDCWTLLKQVALVPDEEVNKELAAIGKEIAKKCEGLPLAAQALGGLLRLKRDEREWIKVRDSEIWTFAGENSVLPALRLSYLNLPLESRQCFSFCAIFPKDYIIEKEELVHLWMANGFISSRGIMMVEDIGDQIINELCSASFFQDIEVDDFGNVKRFKIHGLIHDLAQFVMDDACRIVDDWRPIKLQRRLRHIRFGYYTPTWDQLGTCGQTLRTICTPSFELQQPSSNMQRSFGSLRALDMSRSRYPFATLPHWLLSSFIHCKHLRYLNLGGHGIKKLPESISGLCNLQVLNLNSCRSLQQLPHRLKCLKALRHLCLRGCVSLSRMPDGMSLLLNLRTLNIYIVGKKEGTWLAELRPMYLRGELHIKNLERVRSVEDAKEASLERKELDELFLSWARNSQSELQQNADQILEALEPHPKLVTLGVGGYRGLHLPNWMGSTSLQNLWYVRLMDCSCIVKLSQLGKLPCLKQLTIHNMHDVQYVDDESYDGGVARGFPCLEYLFLSYMPRLERLSKEEGVDMFPCLSKLCIVACPEFGVPFLPSVKELRIAKTWEELKVHHISRQVLPEGLIPVGNSNQLDSIGNLNRLEILRLENDQELTSFPPGMLQQSACLRQLHIYRYTRLNILPTDQLNLVALEELFIYRCHRLESLKEQELKGLPSLKTLQIDRCFSFKGLSTSFECLTSLKRLIISYCPEVVVLSEDLQHIPALQSITLHELGSLEFMPDCWGRLSSLQSLHIAGCPNLASLPLSDECLANLKSLTIVECPDLEKQLERKTRHHRIWIKHTGLQLEQGSPYSSDSLEGYNQNEEINSEGI